MNLDRFAVLPQFLLPKQLLTTLMGRLASRERGALTRWMIRTFIRRYGVDMGEAAEPDPTAYPTFNAFFTRPLRAGVRPFASTPWISPVDGTVSQLGPIRNGRLVQAKGHDYSLKQLLGGDGPLAEALRGGSFATLYLAPRDYHRVHMPRAGALVSMRYVPGALFSVNPLTARGVPGLFARNERIICRFADPDGQMGDFVMVLVGATIVGSIETTWHGVVTPPRTGGVRTWIYPIEGAGQSAEASAIRGAALPVRMDRGEEMGRFALGSTVIVLLPPDADVAFSPRWQPGVSIRLGEAMAGPVDGPVDRPADGPMTGPTGRA